MLVRMRRGGHWGVVVRDPDAGPIKPQTVRRVARTFKPYKGKVGLVAVAISITSVLGIVNPLLIRSAFDTALFPHTTVGGRPVFLGPDLGRLYWIVGFMVGIPILSGFIRP